MQYHHWCQAISNEFDALIRNGTQFLVPPPKGQNSVACKCLFRVIRNLDDLVARYKVCLVAKGFTQYLRIDFKETFVSLFHP